jgi:hypothetical protein
LVARTRRDAYRNACVCLSSLSSASPRRPILVSICRASAVLAIAYPGFGVWLGRRRAVSGGVRSSQNIWPFDRSVVTMFVAVLPSVVEFGSKMVADDGGLTSGPPGQHALFGTRGSQLQILPLRPILRSIRQSLRHRYRHRYRHRLHNGGGDARYSSPCRGTLRSPTHSM